MNKKNVLLLIPYLAHYRREALELLAEKLKSENFSFTIFTGQNRMKKEIPCADIKGAWMKQLESQQFRFFGANIGFQRGLIKSLGVAAPDAVVCLFIPGHMGHVLALLYCLRKKIPFLLWGCAYERLEAGRATRLIRRPIRRFFLDRAAGHICYGKELKKELLGRGIAGQRIWIAQNTVNVERIAKESEAITRQSARGNIGIQENSIVYLFVGALIKPKNLEALVRAFSVMNLEHSSAELYIVGQGVERAHLEELCQQLEMSKNIIFTGAKYDADLRDYFAAADVFVMPGTGGLAVNEAMAYGLPVIAAEGDGTVADLVDHQQSGYVLKNQCSFEEVLEALRWFFSAAGQGVVDSSEAIRDRILTKASMENMVKNFFDAIRTTVDRGNAKGDLE